MRDVPETTLQKAVWLLLSDPARTWQTLRGHQLQILAPGELNVHEGPDFLDMVLLLDGTICVGDGEFHRHPREWDAHGHAADPRYRRVLLHIVLVPPPSPPTDVPDVLLIPQAELHEALQRLAQSTAEETSLVSVQDLQYFALMRLLRHTADARVYAQRWGSSEGFFRLAADFLQRYLQKRRRPVHSAASVEALLHALPTSGLSQLLKAFHSGSVHNLALQLQESLRQRIATEGLHLRLELVLNCLLPYLLAHATAEQRIELLAWYWSAPARVHYGHLRRRFPTLPQRYMWQQQGMLEFVRQRGSSLLCRELLATYRFGDMLEFYRTAEMLLAY